MQARWLIRRDVAEIVTLSKRFSNELEEEEIVSLLSIKNIVGMVVEDGYSNIMGVMIYKLRKTDIEVLHIFGENECFPILIAKLNEKCFGDFKRNRFSLVVNEKHDSLINSISHSLRECVSDFGVSLSPNYFGDCDGVKFDAYNCLKRKIHVGK